MALFSAENDWLADPTDFQFIRKNLPNIVYDQFIDDWDHLDFLWYLKMKLIKILFYLIKKFIFLKGS